MHRILTSLFELILLPYGLMLGQANLRLTGRVTVSLGDEETSDPVKGALLRLSSVVRVLQSQADRNGIFEFVNVPQGEYDLDTSAAGFKTNTLRGIQIVGSEIAPLAIYLRVANQPSDCSLGSSVSYGLPTPKGTPGVHGIVEKYAKKRPLTKTKLYLSTSGEQHALAVTESNQRGMFRFDNLQPGKYDIRAKHSGYSDEDVNGFLVPIENSTKVTVHMLEQHRIIACQ